MIEWDEWVEMLSEHTRMGQKVQIGPETDLIEDLGMDSVELIAVLDEIEEKWGVDFIELDDFSERIKCAEKMWMGIRELISQKELKG